MLSLGPQCRVPFESILSPCVDWVIRPTLHPRRHKFKSALGLVPSKLVLLLSKPVRGVRSST